MSSLIENVTALASISTLSKHERLVKGIIHSIEDGVVVRGDMLPSVNQMVDELGFARKTIVKAYNELKDRGIVESRNRLGYFVATEDTQQQVKLALLLYTFHPFQEVFYNTLREDLGDRAQVDVFFHHNNITVFEAIFSNIVAQYGMYLISPIQHPRAKELMLTISPNKLLVIDRYDLPSSEYPYVGQRFQDPMYQTLVELKDTLSNFQKVILFFHPHADYPPGVLRAFIRFLDDYQIVGEVESQYRTGTVERDVAYITVGDADLWCLLKDCKDQQLNIGGEVGILSHNDSPIKEIIVDGVTTFSTDFKAMAHRAAQFVLDREPMQEVIPSQLIRRKSL